MNLHSEVARAAALHAGPLAVACIIPAYNAADTIATTIASLRAQTSPASEIIVVDDGSTDATVAVALAAAAGDPSVRILSQPNGGSAAARNHGIAATRCAWFLFLDADDWLAPTFFAQLSAALLADPELDAVHCGWQRVTPDAELGPPCYAPETADLFPSLASSNPLATPGICIVRRSLTEAVGAFDVGLRTCQDWDFWLRLARAGARFGAVREPLMFYQLRIGSSSSGVANGLRLFSDALRVLDRAHSPDARVRDPLPAYAQGAPRELLAARQLSFACWCAGLAMGRGQDARHLLAQLAGVSAELSPDEVAGLLFDAVPLPPARLKSAWPALWPTVAPLLSAFLDALEAHSPTPRLAYHTRTALELLVATVAPAPTTIGATYVVGVDLAGAIQPVIPPPGVERLYLAVALEGEPLGSIVLPAHNGELPASALMDALVTAFSWPLLGRFFARTLYPQLRLASEAAGLSVWRGDCLLAAGLPAEIASDLTMLHNRIGWVVFLQELWGQPNWTAAQLYDPDLDADVSQIYAHDGSTTLEISGPLHDVVVYAGELRVRFTVGGVVLDTLQLPAPDGRVRAAAIRAAVNTAGGLALCEAAVRVALLGRSLAVPPATLRERLAAY